MSDYIFDSQEPAEDLRAKLNRETSKIGWNELQKFYAKGAVIKVAKGVDLIEVAMQVSEDNKTAVEAWLADGSIAQVDDQQARIWYEQDATHWAVVVAPWVFVQRVDDSPTASALKH